MRLGLCRHAGRKSVRRRQLRDDLYTALSANCADLPRWSTRPMSDPAFDLRRLGPADAQGWLVLWHAYLTFYHTTLTDNVSDSTFARLTDPTRKNMGAVVAGYGGDLIHRGCQPPAPQYDRQDLFTALAARGLGVARALIGAVNAAARTGGATEVCRPTAKDNAPARRVPDAVATLTPRRNYKQTQ